jgi:phage terminase large subunit-like protein
VVDSKKEIHNVETGTFIKVLSAEAYSKHGINPTVVIFDELHALQKRDLWDVMTFGTGAARKNQLIWIITTAGDDPDRNTVGWEQHEYARKVRDGEITDPSWYVRIYGYDGEDIYNEANWYAANPSLGYTIDIENVRSEALAARNSDSAERLFRWLRLNQWIATKRVGWLPITLWDKTAVERRREELKGRECYLGLDLSATLDLTADCALFPPRKGVDEPWYFFIDAFIPEDGMKEREERDHVPFREWVQKGYVNATPGDCVDYSYLAKHIDRLMRDYKVKYICADPWRLDALTALMDSEIAEKRVIRIPQTIEGMSPAMKEIERLLHLGELAHEINPCGRWCFGNVRVAMDGNENLKPHKGRSIGRIDPIVALIDAMAAAIRLESKRSVYETRGLRTI